MLLAAFAVVLGVCVVLGGLGVWKVYRQRQVGPAALMAALGCVQLFSSLVLLLLWDGSLYRAAGATCLLAPEEHAELFASRESSQAVCQDVGAQEMCTLEAHL